MIKRIRIAIQEKTSNMSQNSVRVAFTLFLFGFLMVAIILAINLAKTGLHLKSDLTETAKRGYEEVTQGIALLHAREFEHAEIMFETAKQTFGSIQNTTWFASSKLGSSAVEDPLFVAGNAVIEGGKSLANAGSLFAESGKNLGSIPRHFFEANRVSYNPATQASLTAELKKELPRLQESVTELTNANTAIQKIPETLVPDAVREKFRFARDALQTSSTFLSETFGQMPAILTLLGDTKPHTFLVLLQNNDEMRPSGGFIGNVLILETLEGYITKTDVIDVYKADHELTETVLPPPEIELVNHKWFLRDSNYSMHFPASAEKAAWFLQKEMGITADSVIAIDASFIQGLLDVTGPISVPPLTKPLTSTNFSKIISYIVESKLNGRDDPKAILRNFMPAFEKALFAHVDPVTLLPFLAAAKEQKHLLAYSKNPAIESFFRANGVSGEMQTTNSDEDYLAIAHTSIGGNKSDAYITEAVRHDTYINSDGSLEDEVTITRTHTWNNATENAFRTLIKSFGYPDATKNIWEILGRSRNLHMLRVYVPKGSVLESSSDAGVTTVYDPDTKKTYFSAQMQVPVAESRTLKIRYKLPFRLDLSPAAKYTLIAQNQPGQDNVTLTKRLLPEGGIFNYASSPKDGVFDPDGVWKLEQPFTRDLIYVSAWGN